MAKINWTAESQSWLKDIFDYIALDDKNAAIHVVDDIYKRVQNLKRFPQMGHRYESFPDREIRILLFGHYRIAYLIKYSGDIDILGVFHGALDIKRYLF